MSDNNEWLKTDFYSDFDNVKS